MRPFTTTIDLGGAPFKTLRADLLWRFERCYIQELLVFTAGNVSLAARLAQVDRAYIYRLMRRHGVRRQEQAA